jgi:hypothetical protein
MSTRRFFLALLRDNLTRDGVLWPSYVFLAGAQLECPETCAAAIRADRGFCKGLGEVDSDDHDEDHPNSYCMDPAHWHSTLFEIMAPAYNWALHRAYDKTLPPPQVWETVGTEGHIATEPNIRGAKFEYYLEVALDQRRKGVSTALGVLLTEVPAKRRSSPHCWRAFSVECRAVEEAWCSTQSARWFM